MPDPLSSIIQSYTAAKQAQYQQQHLALLGEQAQELHDFHQKELENVAKQHQDQLDLSRLVHKMTITQIMNEHMGTPDQAPPSAQQPQVSTSLPNTSGNGLPVASGTTTASPYQYHDPTLDKQFPEGITIDPNYVQREAQNKASAYEALNKPFMERYGQQQKEQELRQQSVEHQRAWDQMNIERTKMGMRPIPMPDPNAPQSQTPTQQSAQPESDLDPAVKQSADSVAQFKTDWSKIPNSGMRLAVQQELERRGQSIPTPQDRDTVEGLGTVQSIYQQAIELAKKYSKDGPLGGSNLLNLTNLTKYNADRKNLLSQVGPLAKRQDMNNRSSDSEMLRQLGGLFNPLVDTQTNISNIQNHINAYKANLQSHFPMQDENFQQAMKERGVNIFDIGAKGYLDNEDENIKKEVLSSPHGPGTYQLNDGRKAIRDKNGNVTIK